MLSVISNVTYLARSPMLLGLSEPLAAMVPVTGLSSPLRRRHHQLQLHPAGTVTAALHPLTELLGHRPLLPGQLADGARVAECGHHPHAAPGRGEPSGADEADLLLPAGTSPRWRAENPSSPDPVPNPVEFFLLEAFLLCSACSRLSSGELHLS